MGSKRADDASFLSLYIDAQIHSHVPRRNPGDWALEISGSILVSEKTKARFGSRPETEIGTLRAFLIPTQEARREGFDACAVLNAKSFATSEYTQLFKNAEWRKRVYEEIPPSLDRPPNSGPNRAQARIQRTGFRAPCDPLHD